MKEIISIEATDEQKEYARSFLNIGDIAHRKDFDGDHYKQLFGVQAQIVVSDYLGVPRAINEKRFDGGYDLVWNNKRWDVKCELRNVPFKPKKFVHNLSGHQVNYETDGYIFVSYNAAEGIFQICGFILKEDFRRLAIHYGYQDSRVRDDGSVMTVQGSKGLFELKHKFLTQFERVKQ